MLTAAAVEKVKSECVCPIGYTLLDQPVVTADGHTYQDDAIRGWWRTCDERFVLHSSPATGLALNNDKLIPNRTLRQILKCLPGQPDSAAAASASEAASQYSEVVDITGTALHAELCCPVNKKIFKDPVVFSDGYTYERRAIIAHVRRCWATGATLASPVIGESIDDADVVFLPNYCIKGIVAALGLTPTEKLYVEDDVVRLSEDFAMALSYLEGNGVPRDVVKAVNFLRAADAIGDLRGTAKLGDCYWFGIGVDRDSEVALRLLRKAADGGDALEGVVKLYTTSSWP